MAAQKASLQEVYPGSGEIRDETLKYLADHPAAGLVEINVVYQTGVPVGVIYTVEIMGYNGLIRTLAAFDITSGTITGIKVLKQSETPGLGNNSTAKWFSERFLAKSAAAKLEVTKVKPVG